MRNSIFVFSLAAMLCAGAGGASAQADGQALTRSQIQGAISDMVKIETQGIMAATSDGNDAIVVMTDNGRYAIVGKIYDMWQGKNLYTLDEVRASKNIINLKALNINSADLGPITFGSGPKEAVVFVDPNCPHCAALMAKMVPLVGQYTFRIMVVPALGKTSEMPTVFISCAKDRQAAMKTLMAHGRADALEQDPGCDKGPIQRRLVSAQLFGIRGVPFVIAPDGRTNAGNPADLERFLAGS